MSDRTKTAEEIRAEIEDTRAHMSEDIEALKQRLDPATMRNDVKERVQERVRETSSKLVGRAMENPSPLALLGLGLMAAGLYVGYTALQKQNTIRGDRMLPPARSGMQQAHTRERRVEVFNRETDEGYFRQHFKANFAHAGQAFEAYAPAYQLGASLAQVHHDRPWGEVEVEAKERWEASFDKPWRTYQNAVRYGYERGRMREPQAKVHPTQ
jgi:hypothetical protein